MTVNYEKKVYMTKKQQQEQNKSKTTNSDKLDELKEKIDEYERKNDEYKQKISNMFDLKEKQEENEKKIIEKKFDPKNHIKYLGHNGTRKISIIIKIIF